jgi:hypothetical protein
MERRASSGCVIPAANAGHDFGALFGVKTSGMGGMSKKCRVISDQRKKLLVFSVQFSGKRRSAENAE